MLQRPVMLRDAGRNRRFLQFRDVEIFVDRGDVDSGRTGTAVVAVDAVPLEIVAAAADDRRVVAFGVGEFQISNRFPDLRAEQQPTSAETTAGRVST